ncbi:MAG TPA: hypothetical protein VMF08_08445 [Candidatus Sulfotelmatobacter sp.]|nr:hypothetical protein [Candidatus Sulfotelmatobacter sp.]
MQNGNFEAGGGSFEDWQISHTGTQTNFSGPTIASPGFDTDPYYARFLFESGSDDILSQDISTTPGDVYDINFWAEDGAGHDLAANLDFGNFSANLLTAFSIGPGEFYPGWTNFNFDVTATELETELSFVIWADTGSEFGLDDISVVQFPVFDGAAVGTNFNVTVTSPASATVVQASTNLVNWVAVFTNTPPFTFTDSISQFPHRFYRVAVLVQPSQ